MKTHPRKTEIIEELSKVDNILTKKKLLKELNDIDNIEIKTNQIIKAQVDGAILDKITNIRLTRGNDDFEIKTLEEIQEKLEEVEPKDNYYKLWTYSCCEQVDVNHNEYETISEIIDDFEYKIKNPIPCENKNCGGNNTLVYELSYHDNVDDFKGITLNCKFENIEKKKTKSTPKELKR